MLLSLIGSAFTTEAAKWPRLARSGGRFMRRKVDAQCRLVLCALTQQSACH
jgi:hypothetical protein